MAIQHKSRVKETASNKPNAATAFNLPRSAATGYRTFYAALTSGNQCPYFATNGTDWESGLGTFASGTPDTLTRSKIYESSTGSAIDWSSGANVDIFIELPANHADLILAGRLTEIANSGSVTQSISAWTDTKIGNALDNVIANPYSWWDAANKKFAPTIAGVYLIRGLTSCPGNLEYHASKLFKNGTTEIAINSQARNSSSGAGSSAEIVTSIYLNGTTDFIELYFIVGASGITTSTAAGTFYFSAKLESVN